MIYPNSSWITLANLKRLAFPRHVYPRTLANNPTKQQWGRPISSALRADESKDLDHKQELPSTATQITLPTMSNLFHDVDEFFDKNPFFSSSKHDFMNHFWKQMDAMDDMRRKRFFGNTYLPSYDVHSDNDKVQVCLDVPGVTMNDIDVNIEHDKFLHVNGIRKAKSDDGNTVKEMKFDQRFNFGKDVIDSTKVVANLTNGVLTITLPKLPSAKLSPDNVKKIEVIQGADELEC